MEVWIGTVGLYVTARWDGGIGWWSREPGSPGQAEPIADRALARPHLGFIISIFFVHLIFHG